MSNLTVEQTLSSLHEIRNGSFKVTRQMFRNSLKRSIGATKDYADGCCRHFQDSPLHYICSRSHTDQQLELVRLCLKLSKEQS
jgi:hypothetical protein